MKPKVDRTKPLAEITFHCPGCKATLKAAPARVEDDPEAEHHPFAYFAICPACKNEVGQAPWERALLKAWANATGPVTPEGKAETAKNLEGHPTKEEALRTRFNSMKHGLSARTAQYFPARPDGYAFCKACEVDREWCGRQAACVKQTQLFMLHHAAFETRDPKHLKGIYADMQAAVTALVQQIIQTIIADGPKLTTPEYYSHEGICYVAEFIDGDTKEKKTIYNVQAHPLFKPLEELLSRNNMSLADMGMTTKVIELEHDELGRLQSQSQDRLLISDFMRQTKDSQDALGDMMKRALEKRGRDPVLIEQQQEGD